MRSLAQAFFVCMLHSPLFDKDVEVQIADVTYPKTTTWGSGNVEDELTLHLNHCWKTC